MKTAEMMQKNKKRKEKKKKKQICRTNNRLLILRTDLSRRHIGVAYEIPPSALETTTTKIFHL